MACWKARVRLPIRHNWTFFASSYRWGATRQNGSLLSGEVGEFEPIFQGEGVVSGEYFLVSTKLDTFCYRTMQTAPCYVPSFWHNTGVWQTDGETDEIAVANTALSMRALRRAVKTIHCNIVHNFANCWPIFKICSVSDSLVSMQQNRHWLSHHTLNVSLHYLVKHQYEKTIENLMHASLSATNHKVV